MVNLDEYEGLNDGFNVNRILKEEERILWEGKPDKKAFRRSIIFERQGRNIRSLIGITISMGVFGALVIQEGFGKFEMLIIAAAYAIFLIPIFIWLYKIATSDKRCDNTTYCITNKRIIINPGLARESFKSIYLTGIRSASVKVDKAKKKLNVSDIEISHSTGFDIIWDLKDANMVCEEIKKAVETAKEDFEYEREKLSKEVK